MGLEQAAVLMAAALGIASAYGLRLLRNKSMACDDLYEENED